MKLLLCRTNLYEDFAVYSGVQTKYFVKTARKICAQAFQEK